MALGHDDLGADGLDAAIDPSKLYDLGGTSMTPASFAGAGLPVPPGLSVPKEATASDNVACAMQAPPPKHGEELARHFFYVGRASYREGPIVFRTGSDHRDVAANIAQDRHGNFNIECNLPARNHLTDALSFALRDLLNDTWSHELDNGQIYCSGCCEAVGGASQEHAPGSCGSSPADCSVVRVCLTLGLPVQSATPGTRKLMDERLDAARIAAAEADRRGK